MENHTVNAGLLDHLGVTAPACVPGRDPLQRRGDGAGLPTTTPSRATRARCTSRPATSTRSSSCPPTTRSSASDNGTHTFTNGATLQTAGPQTITATDTGNPVTGTANIAVTPGTMLSDVATGDADWKGKIDGVDALFTKGAVSTQMKLKSTSPGSFHWRLTLQNETGLELHEKNVDDQRQERRLRSRCT